MWCRSWLDFGVSGFVEALGAWWCRRWLGLGVPWFLEAFWLHGVVVSLILVFLRSSRRWTLRSGAIGSVQEFLRSSRCLGHGAVAVGSISVVLHRNVRTGSSRG